MARLFSVERLKRVRDEFRENLGNGTEKYWQDFLKEMPRLSS